MLKIEIIIIFVAIIILTFWLSFEIIWLIRWTNLFNKSFISLNPTEESRSIKFWCLTRTKRLMASPKRPVRKTTFYFLQSQHSERRKLLMRERKNPIEAFLNRRHKLQERMMMMMMLKRLNLQNQREKRSLLISRSQARLKQIVQLLYNSQEQQPQRVPVLVLQEQAPQQRALQASAQ